MRAIALFFGLILSFSANAQTGKPVNDMARGELLYSTHCVACHAIEIHWREQKLVSNWSSLKMQVSRWQKTAALGWGADEIEQVSLYLNAKYYHLPDVNRVGLSSPGVNVIKAD
jgi:mono/diheme cytochrome c family protein